MTKVPANILVSIVGHLAGAPRVQKEAAALVRGGYKVSIRGVWWSDQLAAEDLELAGTIGADFAPLVDLRPKSKTALKSRIQRRIAVELYQRLGWVTPRSFGNSGPEFVAEAKRLQPDLVIVHSEAGLWAGKKLLEWGLRVGVDFEDWLSEDLLPEARKGRPVAALKELEHYHLKHASYCTTTTVAMAEAMAKDAKVDRIPMAIPNCFPWAERSIALHQPGDPRGEEISFYWYSQTVGQGRGLEELGQVLMAVRGNWKLRLRGTLRASEGWFDKSFPAEIRERVELLGPVSNTELLARHMSHDVGLALEIPYGANKNLTASNKIFDYLRAGLAVIATDTEGQCEVMADCPDAGWLVSAGNFDTLVRALQAAINDPEGLARRKQAALEAAERRWSWERYEPSLVRLIESVLNNRVNGSFLP